MNARECVSFVIVLISVVLLPVISAAVPADGENPISVTQPDGSRVVVTLHGDEWAHWYETEDGFTVVRSAGAYWVYAVRSWEGHLIASDVVAGLGVPPAEPHLRPSAEVMSGACEVRRGAMSSIRSTRDITGTRDIVVILVEFSDTPAGEGSTGPHTQSYFADSTSGVIFGSDQGTMADYFDEVSYGQLSIQGVIANSQWHTSAETELYYGQDCDPGVCGAETSDNCNACIYELAREAVQLADAAGFDFASYDGDGDGVVDHVLIVHAGHDQAGAGGGPDDIWSHRWAIPGGEAVDGKVVEGYTMLSEYDAMNVFAHEFTHDLGAPDLYDYNYDSEPVGDWCNMASNVGSDRPPHVCGLLKIDLDADFSNGLTGWATPTYLTADGNYTVYRLDENSSGSVFVTDPVFSGAERFVVENRQRTGYYDFSVPEAGVVFTHIDMAMPDGSGRFNDGPPNNSYHGAWVERPGDVYSADGAAYSENDGEDRLDPVTTPNTNANGGVGTGLTFKGVGPEADGMGFEFRTGPTYVSGSIDIDTIWHKADSPFVVDGPVTVEDEVTLTLEPGVIVKFTTYDYLNVHGTLIAEGTVSDSIVFTSYADDEHGGDTNQNGYSTGSPGQWQYISFNESDAGCSLEYCLIRYAGRYHGSSNRYREAVIIQGTGVSLTMTNSIVELTAGSSNYYPYAIRGHSNTTIEMSECEVRDNGGFGIYTNGVLTLLNSTVSGNARSGVGQAGAGSTVADCILSDNAERGLYLSGANSTVTRNRVMGNYAEGVYVTGQDSVVEDNFIEGSDTGWGLRVEGTNCSVVRDTVQNSYGGIYCSGLAAAFHDNISSDNGDFGWHVHAELVDDTWLSNVTGVNGRDGAIGITGGSVSNSTQWVDEQVYWVDGSFSVEDNTTLTLEPGVIVKFTSYNYLSVQGTLISEGTVSDSIVFTSYLDDEHGGDTNQNGYSTGSPGNWYYIHFNESDAGCSLEYCLIRYAGRYHGSSNRYREAVIIQGTGVSLTMTNSIVELTAGSSNYYPYAIRGHSNTTIEMSECEVRDNGGFGIYTNGVLTLLNSTVSGNARSGVGQAGAGSTVADCILSDNAERGLYLSGANSTVTRNRVMGNYAEGVYVTGQDSVVEDNFIEGSDTGWGLRVEGTNCSVVRDTVQNSYGGIYCSGLAAAFHDNISSDNGDFGWHVHAELVDDTWLSNVTGVNGRDGAIGITGGSVSNSTQWVDEQVYWVDGSFSVEDNTTLTLEPGVIVKFTSYNYLSVQGTLISEGTVSDSIVFTSYLDDEHGGDTNQNGYSTGSPGNWYYIHFNDADAGCSLEYCLVRYAGRYHGYSNRYREAVIIQGTGVSLTMTNSIVELTAGSSNYYPYAIRGHSNTTIEMSECEVRDNGGTGIYTNGVLTLLNSTVSGNEGDGVYLSAGSGSIEYNAVSDNSGRGFYVHPAHAASIGATCSLQGNGHGDSISLIAGHISTDTSWENSYTYLCRGSLTIDEEASLILNKGVVVKFDGCHDLVVNGALVAQGDAIEKVIFTSYKDDAYGGDTNGDGVNTLPLPGDWGRLRFEGAHPASRLGWAVVTYGGCGNDDAIYVDNCDLEFSECIVAHNLDRAVFATSTGEIDITNSDIYGNGFGIENQNSLVPATATNCWWGDASGPYHSSTNPEGQGDAVSDYVVFDPWLDRSIDNPWIAFTSPSISGNYADVIVFDLDEDDYPDLIASTAQSGLEVFRRTGFESWESLPSPITDGQYGQLVRDDLNSDGHDDFLVCGASGVRCFIGDGAGGLTEVYAPIVGYECSSARFAHVDHDGHIDVIACSSNNEGVWVAYGDGTGSWTLGTQPTSTNSYNSIAGADFDGDTYLDLVATSGEYHGVRVWYGSATGDWAGPVTIADGQAFFALDVGDVDKDGDFDLAVGANQSGIGIRVYLNDGAGGWDASTGPTATGIYNDLILADLNGDSRLDIAAASQGGGIRVWVGTSSLVWNYWYHPAESHIYNGICVGDFTLNGSPDLAGAATIHGLALWDNVTPGVFQEYFSMSPERLDFGPILLGECAHEAFDLENTSPDTLYNVVVYTTNPEFDASLPGRDAGPFDLLPGEIQEIEVEYCPTDTIADSEAVIIHSSLAVTHIRATGSGVPYIEPVWSIDLLVENAAGAPDGSIGLTVGGGVGATDGLDIEAGEVCLPPLPPSEVFDARLELEGCEGSLVSIHDVYATRDTFELQWQPGAAGCPVTVSWNPNDLPAGTFLISDVMGGAFIDTLNMADTSQVVIPTEWCGMVTDLAITVLKHSTFEYDLDDGWHLLSLAVTTVNDSLADLFPTAVSAFGWSDGYVVFDELHAGYGYWVNVAADDTVSHVGEQVRRIDRTLDEGWSLIGSVFDTVSVADIQVVPSGSIESVFGFDGGYFLADELVPGMGYWIDVANACDIAVVLPGGRDGSPGLAEPAAMAAVTREPLTRGTWEFDLDVGPEGSAEARNLVLGVADGATSGIDVSVGEHEAPPLPPGTLFGARFIISGTNGTYRDMREAGAPEHVHEISWQTGASDRPIVVAWDPESIPDHVRLVLTDNLDGLQFGPVDMRQAGAVSFGEEQAHISGVRITARYEDDAEDASLVFALPQNSPNPFSAGTAIRYQLPSQSSVELCIYDAAGRVVRRLDAGLREAGDHNAVWDGRDDAGNDVASGVYFVKLKAADKALSRKIVLLR